MNHQGLKIKDRLQATISFTLHRSIIMSVELAILYDESNSELSLHIKKTKAIVKQRKNIYSY